MRHWTPDELQALLDHLASEGYRVLGPKLRDEAIIYDDIASLPVGLGDSQDAGRYRVTQRRDQSRFGYNLGPGSWKQFLFPPEESVFRFQNGEFVSTRAPAQKMAFVGVRGCELAAIQVQDRVFMGESVDPGYAARRKELLLIAVNCSQAAATCFCDSTGNGPAVGHGADLVITEFNPENPFYLVSAGTVTGERLLAAIGGSEATPADAERVDEVIQQTRQQMQRSLETAGLSDALIAALDHPHWNAVADRCLACGNCTQVCPTCFCHSSHEDVDPVSNETTHLKRWDSCFTAGHSYTAGGLNHGSVMSRYRQWLTHKLATWELQFGTSGCTGCGRCISWCPVGIDITAEVARLREPA